MRSGLQPAAISCSQNFYHHLFALPADVRARPENDSDASNVLRSPFLCKIMNCGQLAFSEVRAGPRIHSHASGRFFPPSPLSTFLEELHDTVILQSNDTGSIDTLEFRGYERVVLAGLQVLDERFELLEGLQ